jgi:hypothetical protein
MHVSIAAEEVVAIRLCLALGKLDRMNHGLAINPAQPIESEVVYS